MNGWKALFQHIQRVGLRLKCAFPKAGESQRDLAFRKYSSALARKLTQPATEFKVEKVEKLSQGKAGHHVLRLRFLPVKHQHTYPGDLVYVQWSHPPESVNAVVEIMPAPPAKGVKYWTQGSAYAPSRLHYLSARKTLATGLELRWPSSSLREKVRGTDEDKISDQKTHSLLDFLAQFPELADWKVLLNRQERIRPRLYTLSKASHQSGGVLELLVSVNETQAGAAAYLSRLKVGDRFAAHILSHPHHLPAEYGHPGGGLILANGTGVAGVLAYLRSGKKLNDSHLAWGIRSESYARIDQRELDEFVESGALGKLSIIESRLPSGQRGTYVQNALRDHRDWMQPFLSGNGWVYISGSETMACDIRRIFEQYLAGGGAERIRREADMQWVESVSGGH